MPNVPMCDCTLPGLVRTGILQDCTRQGRSTNACLRSTSHDISLLEPHLALGPLTAVARPEAGGWGFACSICCGSPPLIQPAHPSPTRASERKALGLSSLASRSCPPSECSKHSARAALRLGAFSRLVCNRSPTGLLAHLLRRLSGPVGSQDFAIATAITLKPARRTSNTAAGVSGTSQERQRWRLACNSGRDLFAMATAPSLGQKLRQLWNHPAGPKVSQNGSGHVAARSRQWFRQQARECLLYSLLCSCISDTLQCLCCRCETGWCVCHHGCCARTA